MPSGSNQRKRVLSGMRPTGKLHLGNYVGALQNWVGMQDQYECFFCVVDWHALTTDYADTSQVKANSVEVLLDWLAAGLDPERSTLFMQSHVPQHAELHLLFSMITPLGWLERVPTYKEQRENITDKDLSTYGFLGYPVLQAADILIYKGDFVPVGEDQVPHVELTREIARRFNMFYKRNGAEVFPEPQPLLTRAPKLPGTDGRKMSKSYGNTIMLTDPEYAVREKLRTMVNDPARARRSDPGNPEICPVGDLHRIFSDTTTIERVIAGCSTAGISCIDCKTWAADALVNKLAPMQERRRVYEESPGHAWQILEDGSATARRIADETMREVRQAMGISIEYEFSLAGYSKSRMSPDTRLFGDENLWNMTGAEFGDAMLERWQASLPSNITLRQDAGSRRLFTESNKRVGVASAHERHLGQWVFTPLDRHNDVLVLLALTQKPFEIINLVLPQKILQPNWKKFGREPRTDTQKKGELVRLGVRSKGSDFFLDVPGEEPLPITGFRSNYAPFL